MIQRLVTFCSSQKQYEFLLQIVTKNNNISRGKGRDSKLIVGFTDYLWRIVSVFLTRAKKKAISIDTQLKIIIAVACYDTENL